MISCHHLLPPPVMQPRATRALTSVKGCHGPGSILKFDHICCKSPNPLRGAESCQSPSWQPQRQLDHTFVQPLCRHAQILFGQLGRLNFSQARQSAAVLENRAHSPSLPVLADVPGHPSGSRPAQSLLLILFPGKRLQNLQRHVPGVLL